MSKPVLGLDLDDVIGDHVTALFDFHNTYYGTSFTRNDLREYDFEVVWGCSRDEMRQRIARFCESSEHLETSMLPGAVESIEKLIKKYDIHLITARPDQFRSQTLDWLEQHLPTLTKRIHFTRKVVDGEQRPKSEVCRELGVSIFVDDALHHAEDLAPAVEKVFLFDTPWNQTKEDLPENVKRVYSWEEITKQLLPL